MRPALDERGKGFMALLTADCNPAECEATAAPGWGTSDEPLSGPLARR